MMFATKNTGYFVCCFAIRDVRNCIVKPLFVGVSWYKQIFRVFTTPSLCSLVYCTLLRNLGKVPLYVIMQLPCMSCLSSDTWVFQMFQESWPLLIHTLFGPLYHTLAVPYLWCVFCNGPSTTGYSQLQSVLDYFSRSMQCGGIRFVLRYRWLCTSYATWAIIGVPHAKAGATDSYGWAWALGSQREEDAIMEVYGHFNFVSATLNQMEGATKGMGARFKAQVDAFNCACHPLHVYCSQTLACDFVRTKYVDCKWEARANAPQL